MWSIFRKKSPESRPTAGFKCSRRDVPGVEAVRRALLSAVESRSEEGTDPLDGAYLSFLHLSRNGRGFAIAYESEGRRLALDEWEHACPGGESLHAARLVLLVEEGLAVWDDEALEVLLPDITACRLETSFLEHLGAPAVSDVTLTVNWRGTPFSEDFDYRFRLLRNRCVLDRPVIDGMVVTIAGRDYMMECATYWAVELLTAFSRTTLKSAEGRNALWAQTTEVLEKTLLKNRLKQFQGDVRLKTASRISVIRDADGNLSPVLLRTKVRGDEEPEYVPLLNKLETASLIKYIDLPLDEVRSVPLGGASYVVLTPEIKRVFNVIREYRHRAPVEQAEFYDNPHRVLRRVFESEGLELPEDTLSCFVETPEFLSDRVKVFGVWTKENCQFIQPRPTSWFPEDRKIAVVIDDEYVWVDVEDIGRFVSRLEEADRTNVETIEWEGATYDITGIDVPGLGRTLRPLKDAPAAPASAGPEDGEPRRREESAPDESSGNEKVQFGPIIERNLHELKFVASRREHPGYDLPLEGPSGGFSLYPHQKECLEWLSTLWTEGYPGALLADDMGLGKTLQCLSFIEWLRINRDARGEHAPALVVAPLGLLSNWRNEGLRYYPGLGEPLLLDSTTLPAFMKLPVDERLSRIQAHEWVLTNYESVRSRLSMFTTTNWGVMVLDEAQKIKNPQALLTECIKSVKTDFALAMTGTPIENSFTDLWSIMDTAVPGFLGALEEFSGRYCGEDVDDEEAGRELHLLLTGGEGTDGTPSGRPLDVRPLMLRRTKEDRLKAMPRKIEDVRRVVMSTKQAAHYHAVYNQCVAEESTNALEKLHRLTQAALSVQEMEPGTDLLEDPENDSARLSETFRILDEVKRAGEKAIVFVQHRAVQLALAKALEKRFGMDHRPGIINGNMKPEVRQQIVETFQNGPEGFDVLVLSGRAAGVGLTITAANHVIHLERWWNPAVEDQCSDRAYRIGQKKDVIIHIPLAVFGPGDEGSFDCKLHAYLDGKRSRCRHALMPMPKEDTKELAGLVFGGAA